MKPFGILILALGLFGVLAALGMDTSIDTPFGPVNNLGLMKDQQNYVMVSALIVLVGIIMVVGSRSTDLHGKFEKERPDDGTKNCPECAEIIKREAKVCRFCGNREFGAQFSVRSDAVATLTSHSHNMAGKTNDRITFPVVFAIVVAVVTTAIAATWMWGDRVDASGDGTYTAKDVLLGAWLDLTDGSNVEADAAATENISAADVTDSPSKNGNSSAPDSNGCVKELAEQVGLHCARE